MFLRFAKNPALRNPHLPSSFFARHFCTDNFLSEKYDNYVEKYKDIPKQSLIKTYEKLRKEYLQSEKLEASKAEEMRVELRVLHQLCNESQDISDIKREEEVGTDYRMAPNFGGTVKE